MNPNDNDSKKSNMDHDDRNRNKAEEKQEESLNTATAKKKKNVGRNPTKIYNWSKMVLLILMTLLGVVVVVVMILVFELQSSSTSSSTSPASSTTSSSTINIPVAGDTYIRNGVFATTNYGRSETILLVKNNPSGDDNEEDEEDDISLGLLEFDLRPLLQPLTTGNDTTMMMIQQVRLIVHHKVNDNVHPSNVSVHMVDPIRLNTTVEAHTYSTFPTNDESILFPGVTRMVQPNDTTIVYDLTPVVVQYWINKDHHHHHPDTMKDDDTASQQRNHHPHYTHLRRSMLPSDHYEDHPSAFGIPKKLVLLLQIQNSKGHRNHSQEEEFYPLEYGFKKNGPNSGISMLQVTYTTTTTSTEDDDTERTTTSVQPTPSPQSTIIASTIAVQQNITTTSPAPSQYPTMTPTPSPSMIPTECYDWNQPKLINSFGSKPRIPLEDVIRTVAQQTTTVQVEITQSWTSPSNTTTLNWMIPYYLIDANTTACNRVYNVTHGEKLVYEIPCRSFPQSEAMLLVIVNDDSFPEGRQFALPDGCIDEPNIDIPYRTAAYFVTIPCQSLCDSSMTPTGAP